MNSTNAPALKRPFWFVGKRQSEPRTTAINNPEQPLHKRSAQLVLFGCFRLPFTDRKRTPRKPAPNTFV